MDVALWVDNAVAEIPHVFGFRPSESVVVMPVGGLSSCARVDVPRTGAERRQVTRALRLAYVQHARAGASAAVVCIGADRGSARLVTEQLASGLHEAGVAIPMQVWVDADRWVEFESGRSGRCLPRSVEHVAVKTVVAGALRPAADRASLMAAFEGDEGRACALLPATQAEPDAVRPVTDRTWASARAEQFGADGRGLSDLDAARMLFQLQDIAVRDALWQSVSDESLNRHISLWFDLTRRAPRALRAAPASLLGFCSWLRGDGVRAWCALDRVPDDQSYSMGLLMASILQHGLHPGTWSTTDWAVVPAGATSQQGSPTSSLEDELREMLANVPDGVGEAPRIDWVHA